VDDFDRRLCKAYLDYLLQDKVCDEFELCPYTNGKLFSFRSISPSTYKAYEDHIEKGIKEETPVSIGMHPNTENSFRINFAQTMFGLLLDILPLDSGADDEEEEGGKASGGNVVDEKMMFIYEAIPKDKSNDFPGRQFDVSKSGIDKKNIRPFQNAFVQEMERINKLCQVICVSLINLQKANAGEMNFTDTIEATQNSLITERIPEHWAKWSFPTMRLMSSWISTIKLRLEFLNDFLENPDSIPRVMWLNKMFNPLAFINSIKQQTCQKEKKPLDEYDIVTDVTSLSVED